MSELEYARYAEWYKTGCTVPCSKIFKGISFLLSKNAPVNVCIFYLPFLLIYSLKHACIIKISKKMKISLHEAVIKISLNYHYYIRIIMRFLIIVLKTFICPPFFKYLYYVYLTYIYKSAESTRAKKDNLIWWRQLVFSSLL